MTKADLIAFEAEVVKRFNDGQIHAPVHISGGNEDRLIEIFKSVDSSSWIFSTYRNHLHALLHGIHPQKIMAQIMAGRSMNLAFPECRFFTSAIVGGILPIAVGAAMAIKRKGEDRKVWCFVGDMAATTGAFHEASVYAYGHQLPIEFVIEDNGMACDTPTYECWGANVVDVNARRYSYQREWPHVCTGTYVNF